MKLGFLGLGKMGSRMVKKLLLDGHEVVAWNRSAGPVEELVDDYESYRNKKITGRLSIVSQIGEFKTLYPNIKVFWLMLPAGEATENVLEQVADIVSDDFIVIDGGNAYYKDTQRRYDKFKRMGVKFLGIGVSGGVIAAKNGFSLMVGGDKEAYGKIKPILKTFSAPHGLYEYFGAGGVGHFIKMVHNGIEYGIMQSLGEGFGVLEKAPYTLSLNEVARTWQKGSIISSFLLDRAVDALDKNPKLSDISGVVAESGEAVWTIEAAKKEGVPIKIIEDSLKFRKQSQKDEDIQQSFAARLVAALRREFGGHAVVDKAK